MIRFFYKEEDDRWMEMTCPCNWKRRPGVIVRHGGQVYRVHEVRLRALEDEEGTNTISENIESEPSKTFCPEVTDRPYTEQTADEAVVEEIHSSGDISQDSTPYVTVSVPDTVQAMRSSGPVDTIDFKRGDHVQFAVQFQVMNVFSRQI